MKANNKRVKSSKYLPTKTKKDTPGPGAYDAHPPDFKPLYEQVKVSGNFVECKKQRFDDMYVKNNSQEHKKIAPGSY